MHRCYLPNADFSAPALTIEREEAHHALRVLRMRAGEECEVFDGCGNGVRGRIVAVQGSSALTVGELQPLPPEPPRAQITLAVALAKGTNTDLIMQKAVELGAARIIPIVSERTIVRLKPDEAQAKAEKWRRTVLEACKQSGVRRLPAVEVPQPLPAFLQRADLPALKLVCAITPQAQPLRHVLEPARARGESAAVVLIGPEGDFSPAEYDSAAAAGFTHVSLGSIILRVETAVFTALASLRYALDE